MSIIIYFDGSCIDNPMGAMGYGFVIESKNLDLYEERFSGCPADYGNSNNKAEYLGLLLALEFLAENRIENQHVTIYGDSKMVIDQCTGKKGMNKNARYRDTGVMVLDTIESLIKNANLSFNFGWIPREENSKADVLSNKYYNT